MIDFSPLDRHEKIGLCASGGKDSMACLWLLREHLHRITVYYMATGDTMPETKSIIAEIKGICPNFVHIQGDVRSWISEYGHPTDLLPYSTHGIGVQLGQSGVKLVTRYHCCWVNLMHPLWDRVKSDGNTLCIRGTKRIDTPTMATEQNSVHDGIEMWFPVAEWSHAEVHDYLQREGAPRNALYDGLESAPDCGRCTAYLDEKRGKYLKQHHPELFADYTRDLKVIAREVAKPINALRAELMEMI